MIVDTRMPEPAAPTILGLAEGFKIIRKPRASCFQDTASAPLGLEGLQVTDAQKDPDCALTVWLIAGHPGWGCTALGIRGR